MKTVWQYKDSTGLIIQLKQSARSKMYCVEYGPHIVLNLTYDQAVRELGECLMHYLACESLIKV